MINKSKVIFPSDSEELKNIISRACDLYNKAIASGAAFYTKFLSPSEAAAIMGRFPKNEISLKLCGGYEEAERCMCAFFTYEDDLAFPYALVSLKSKAKNVTLSHRDYLGSVLALGIKRETLGDIIIRDNEALIFCLEEISDYIIDHLTKIGNTGVTAERIWEADSIEIKRDYDMVSATVSSLRCDAVIASALNIARSKASELIERGLVNLNYEQAKSVSAPVKDGDVISARGYGKFKIQTDGHLTKKGRIHVNVCKYK